MGLFGRSKSSISDGVRGTGQVVVATTYNRESAAAQEMCTVDLVVEAAGIPATAAKVTGLVRADRWPTVGQVLPVLISRADPTLVEVLWDEAPDASSAASAVAEEIAAARRREQQ